MANQNFDISYFNEKRNRSFALQTRCVIKLTLRKRSNISAEAKAPAVELA